jgi:hypothetical protein
MYSFFEDVVGVSFGTFLDYESAATLPTPVSTAVTVEVGCSITLGSGEPANAALLGLVIATDASPLGLEGPAGSELQLIMTSDAIYWVDIFRVSGSAPVVTGGSYSFDGAGSHVLSVAWGAAGATLTVDGENVPISGIPRPSATGRVGLVSHGTVTRPGRVVLVDYVDIIASSGDVGPPAAVFWKELIGTSEKS